MSALIQPIYRPVHPDEYEEALTLWETVFGSASRDYFRRYFHADPWYQAGDCLGAWVDDRLVSCVHVCPRLLEWRGGTLRCGGIANVATLAEHRGQGLSRALLAQSLDLMWETECAFSLLFTGRPHHYAALGWEQVTTARPTVTLREPLAPPTLEARAAVVTEEVIRLYEESPRPPLIARRRGLPSRDGIEKRYFEDWVGWRWHSSRAEMLLLPERGYLVFTSPPAQESQPERPLEVLEWRALDGAAEGELFSAAAAHAQARGKSQVRLPCLPSLSGPELLHRLGEVSLNEAGGFGMLRNIALPEVEYEEIRSLYASGTCPWFASDGF